MRLGASNSTVSIRSYDTTSFIINSVRSPLIVILNGCFLIPLLSKAEHLTTVFLSVKHHYRIITQSQNNHNGSLRCNYTNLSQEPDKHFGTVRSRRVISIVPAPYNLMPSGSEDLLQQAAAFPYEHRPTAGSSL